MIQELPPLPSLPKEYLLPLTEVEISVGLEYETVE
jgi:hypothetical protein